MYIYIGTLRVGKGREGKGREGEGRGGEGKVFAFQRRFNENPSVIPGCA